MSDSFTTDATAEARRESPLYDNEVLSYGVRMAEWARDRLARQEPTDAEVEAAARKVFEYDAPSHQPHEWFEASEPLRDDYRATARAALSAARRTRGGTT